MKNKLSPIIFCSVIFWWFFWKLVWILWFIRKHLYWNYILVVLMVLSLISRRVTMIYLLSLLSWITFLLRKVSVISIFYKIYSFSLICKAVEFQTWKYENIALFYPEIKYDTDFVYQTFLLWLIRLNLQLTGCESTEYPRVFCHEFWDITR